MYIISALLITVITVYSVTDGVIRSNSESLAAFERLLDQIFLSDASSAPVDDTRSLTTICAAQNVGFELISE